MKARMIVIVFFIVCGLASCKDKDENEFGGGDRLNIDKHEIILSSVDTSAIVTINEYSWWICDYRTIIGQDTIYSDKTIDYRDIIYGEWFTITCDTPNKMIITIQVNDTPKERILEIGLQSANSFDKVLIKQEEYIN